MLYNNSGDTVYYTSGISMFYSKGLDSTFMSVQSVIDNLEQDREWARKNFDICIMMEANIFSEYYNQTLADNAHIINTLKIPTFVLGAGCQSTINYSVDFLQNIKENSKKYIDAIKNSGGDITLRGNFTKFALEQLGYKDLFVSGCPSLFLLNRDFKINTSKICRENFKPMLNAHFVSDISNKIYKDYTNSVFFDQDLYLTSLYNPAEVKDIYDSKYKSPFKELYSQNRILGNMNYYMWRKQIKEGGFNFSYGSRIHGNIIALQNNIPAFVNIIDSRTRELVEFFDIPNSMTTKFNEKYDDLYDLYLNLNYDKFNQNFSKKYDAFKEFLNKNNIPNCLDDNNEYLNLVSTFSFYDYQNDLNVQDAKKLFIKKLNKKRFIYKEKDGNRRTLHVFGIKMRYKI